MYEDHKAIIGEIDRVLSQIDSAEVAQLCDAITNARKIVVFGAGRVGMACRGFAMRLSHLGLQAFALNDATVPSIAHGDLLLIASGSGETPSVRLIAETGLRNGAKLALVTGRKDSTIGQMANAVVVVPAPNKNGGAFTSVQPLTTLNEQCMHVFFDSVVLHLMRILNETSDTMWSRHSNLE